MSDKQVVVVIGKESVGKSQLISGLTGKHVSSGSFKGTTVTADYFESSSFMFIDTPGIIKKSDTLTTRLALSTLDTNDIVLLVIDGTHIDQDLEDLLPLVKGKQGVVVITHADVVRSAQKDISELEAIQKEVGVPCFFVDARQIQERDQKDISQALLDSHIFAVSGVTTKLDRSIKPKNGLFEMPFVGPFLSLIFLFIPAWIAVQSANTLADSLYDPISNFFSPLLETINSLPAPLNHMLGMDYGIVAMFPFLLLYAIPTIFIFALILGIYKASGLVDRLSSSLHKYMQPFGLSGRDLVRIIMGFGCNVPAIINTRACSSCSRTTCISAISFGSACSYQLPATIAVFAAAKMSFLTIPFLVFLAITTLIYIRLTAPKSVFSKANELLVEGRDFLHFPSLASIWSEIDKMIRQFFVVAIPIFAFICVVASLLSRSGVFTLLVKIFSPFMRLFNLPGEAVLSVILGSVRKDGIAIGLLDSNWDALKIAIDSPVQVLTIVYMAGVLLPCIVTLGTIAKEISLSFALRMAGRQAGFALLFSFILAWAGFFIQTIG